MPAPSVRAGALILGFTEIEWKKKAFLAAMRAASIIGQMGVVKLYTHYLLPAQLGKYFFALTVSYSLNALLFVPMDYFQQKEVFKLKESGNSLGGLLDLNAKLLSAVGCIFLLGIVVLALLNGALLSAFCTTVVYSILLYLSTAVKTFLNNQEEQVFVVMMLIAEIPIRIIAFTGIAKLGLAGPLSPIVSTAAALLVVGLCALPRLRSHLKRFLGIEKPVELQTILEFEFQFPAVRCLIGSNFRVIALSLSARLRRSSRLLCNYLGDWKCRNEWRRYCLSTDLSSTHLSNRGRLSTDLSQRSGGGGLLRVHCWFGATSAHRQIAHKR